MKVGDLVIDKRGDIGIITYDYRQSKSPQPHVSVHWRNGVTNSIHIRNLEVISESR